MKSILLKMETEKKRKREEEESNFVTLNCCGKIVKSNRKILEKSEFLRGLIVWNEKSDKPQDQIFINKTYNVFKHVLAYLIDSNYPFPKDLEYELEFFGIQSPPREIISNVVKKLSLEVKLDSSNYRSINTNDISFGVPYGLYEKIEISVSGFCDNLGRNQEHYVRLTIDPYIKDTKLQNERIFTFFIDKKTDKFALTIVHRMFGEQLDVYAHIVLYYTPITA